VNYLYELDQVERNHEAYINEGKITVSRRVEALARGLRWPESETVEQIPTGSMSGSADRKAIGDIS
jgi:hypothetical protein